MAADNLDELIVWIDASYAVHPNIQSHTGAAISMGWGVIHAKSSKQSLNTKSSTEAEIVGVSDYVPYAIHIRIFMEKQGYSTRRLVLNQDNTSTIQMEKNGRRSATGNSRYVDNLCCGCTYIVLSKLLWSSSKWLLLLSLRILDRLPIQ